MSNTTIFILVIAGYVVLRILFRSIKRNNRIRKYGDTFGSIVNQEKIEVGMTKEMVTDALGTPEKSEGTTHKENFIKEVLYYGAYNDEKQKTKFRYRVIFVNNKVTEFHET